MRKKDSHFLIAILLLVLTISIIGFSFAAIFYSKVGDKVNSVTTGTLTMSYSENTNGINLSDAYPMADNIGMTLSESNQYFDFTVSVTTGGGVIVNSVIVASKEENSTLPDEAIKVYLTDLNDNDGQVLAPTKISDLELTDGKFGVPENMFVLLNKSFYKTENRTYRLRMWIDNDYKLPDKFMSYKIRVNVYGYVDV